MIQIKDLVKVYPGPVPALQGINLDIPKGMFGLLGPNGSGKTTLMKILAGLLEPTAGSLMWGGEDITGKPERVWPRLGYLPQYFGFYPNLTGEAMLLHLLRLKGVAAPGGLRKLCDALLDRVNLAYAAKRKVKGYSGGMRQRLGIAQAIAGNPSLIIVDEPTAGLDPEERIRFYRLLSELAEDRTILLSTHIVEDVGFLCPRFAVIRKGRLLAITTPSDAKSKIDGTIYEGGASHNELTAINDQYQVTQALLIEGKNRVRIHLTAGAPPSHFTPSPPTLEDAYLILQTKSAAQDAYNHPHVAGDAS